LPSNSTVASDGGFPGWSGVLAVPGSITFGCGRFMSWMPHSFGGWANVVSANAVRAATAMSAGAERRIMAFSLLSFGAASVLQGAAGLLHSPGYERTQAVDPHRPAGVVGGWRLWRSPRDARIASARPDRGDVALSAAARRGLRLRVASGPGTGMALPSAQSLVRRRGGGGDPEGDRRAPGLLRLPPRARRALELPRAQPGRLQLRRG